MIILIPRWQHVHVWTTSTATASRLQSNKRKRSPPRQDFWDRRRGNRMNYDQRTFQTVYDVCGIWRVGEAIFLDPGNFEMAGGMFAPAAPAPGGPGGPGGFGGNFGSGLEPWYMPQGMEDSRIQISQDEKTGDIKIIKHPTCGLEIPWNRMIWMGGCGPLWTRCWCSWWRTWPNLPFEREG